MELWTPANTSARWRRAWFSEPAGRDSLGRESLDCRAHDLESVVAHDRLQPLTQLTSYVPTAKSPATRESVFPKMGRTKR